MVAGERKFIDERVKKIVELKRLVIFVAFVSQYSKFLYGKN